jgi:hypothetical protein
MARRQTRRTISVSELVYQRARAVAAESGQTLSHFTEEALIGAGVDAPMGTHFAPSVAHKATRNRARGRKVVSGLRVLRRLKAART